jgi:hypothetical protein
MKTILRYIRDFSIVVGGVAITLYVTDRATYRSEKKDIKLYLQTIKIELEKNIDEINQAVNDLQHSIKYTNYLWAHNPDSLSIDSLNYYGPMSHRVDAYFLKTNGFEMFKNSGLMRLMNNKELLTDIWDVYADIDWLKGRIDRYNETKWDEMNKDIALELERKPTRYKARMYNFHIRGLPFKMIEIYENRLNYWNDMVLELEKELSSNR